MTIDPKNKIAGIPTVLVRDFLKRYKNRVWSIDTAQRHFDIPRVAGNGASCFTRQ